MKKLTLVLLAIAFGFSSYAQNCPDKSGPDKNFLIAFRGGVSKFQYAVVSNVTTSTATSNILAINNGGPGILFSPQAFINTVPCYTLGFVKATITVYKAGTNQCVKSATVQLNNIFYYDYPLNYTYIYYEYYIPASAWRLCAVPMEPSER